MARKRKYKETDHSCEFSSPKSTNKNRKLETPKETQRKNDNNEGKKTQSLSNGPKTRSVKEKEETSPKKDDRQKSPITTQQTRTPKKISQSSQANSNDVENEIPSRNPEKQNSFYDCDGKQDSYKEKDPQGRKANHTSNDEDIKESSEQETTNKSEVEVTPINSECNITIDVEQSANVTIVTMTPDLGRRSSGRVRRLTHKAAEAEDSRRVKAQSKVSSPRKSDLELLKSVQKRAETDRLDICNQNPSINDRRESESSTDNGTSAKTGTDDTSKVTSLVTKADIPATEKEHHSNEIRSELSPPQPTPVYESITHPADPVDHLYVCHSDGHPVTSDSSSQVSFHTQKSSCHSEPKSPNQDKTLDSPPRCSQCHACSDIKPIQADIGIQVSCKDRGQLVSTGTQVDDGLALPWQQLHLEGEQGAELDSLSQQSDPSTSSSIDLNSLLTMTESEEKVLGGISALIKDSLLQIQGMRQFVMHDLPVLTHVACFQTADKIAISGTIQGISRAWSILTNIEHNVHNKDPKSKKSVKIQWTGKNGVKKTVEFKKTPESQKASLTPSKPVKPVTVFVDIKSPERNIGENREVIRETGPSHQTQEHSGDNWENSDSKQSDKTPKKQVSLLSGKSFSMSHIKVEGQIGVPVSNPSSQDKDDETRLGDANRTHYTITVGDGWTEDTIVDELEVTSKLKSATPQGMKVKQERLEKDDSFQGNGSGTEPFPCKDSSVVSVSNRGMERQDGIRGNDNDDDNDDVDEDDHSVTWQGRDVDNEVVTVTKSGEYLCEQCQQVFVSRPDLISHRWQAHKTDNTPKDVPSFVECTTCFQRFRCHLELHRHERRAHSLVSLLPEANSVKYTCNVCEKKFSEKRYLTTHLKRHTGIKRHCCNICGWRFFEAHKLKFHLETHKSEADRNLPYRCTICQRQYHNRQSWNDHMNTHTGSKPYTCTICGTGFAHRIGLHRHKLIHEKECQFKCTYCSRGFKVKANLTAHMTIHTGVGKHTCPVCKKVFTVATSLRRHKCQVPEPPAENKEALLGEGPYMFMCGVCNMTFPTLGEAETHSLTHVDNSADMSLVGVQVEEVGGETNILTSDPNDASSTYVIESDSGKQVFVSSSQTAGEGLALVDEVEKIQIAASTLADLSSLSKEAEFSLPGKEIPVATAGIFEASGQEVVGAVDETENAAELVDGTELTPEVDKTQQTQSDVATCHT